MTVCVVMPTVPRRSVSAVEVVRRLLPQVDHMLVHLNGYDEVPAWARDARIRAIINPAGTGPIVRLTVVPEVDHVLLVDDDLAYPADYVARSVTALNRLGPGNVVCYHAVYWPKGAEPTWAQRQLIMYSKRIGNDVRVPMLGAGTAGFHQRDLLSIDRFAPKLFEYANDIWASAACARKGFRVVRIPTPENWLIALPAAFDAEALYRVAGRDANRQRNLAMATAHKMGSWDISLLEGYEAESKKT